jgi:hypothetical protein
MLSDLDFLLKSRRGKYYVWKGGKYWQNIHHVYITCISQKEVHIEELQMNLSADEIELSHGLLE